MINNRITYKSIINSTNYCANSIITISTRTTL